MRNPRGTILLQLVSKEIVPDSINAPGSKQRLIYLWISFSARGYDCVLFLSAENCFSEAFQKMCQLINVWCENIFT